MPMASTPATWWNCTTARTKAHATIKSVLDQVVTLDAPCTLDVADTKVGTPKYIQHL